MPHLKSVECRTRLHSIESEADPIGDLCPGCGSLLEPVGELREIGGYRVVGSRGGAWHGGASWTGQLIAARVGEIMARRGRGRTRVRREMGGRDARSLSPQVPAVSSRAAGTGDEAVRPSRRASPSAVPRRLPRVLHVVDDGRDRR
jgi:hypothetical protein